MHICDADQELLSRCLSKEDASGWEQFVHTYSKLIWSSIHKTFRSYSFPYDPEDVEDVYSTVFLSLVENDFRKLRQFQGRNACTLSTWLAVVAVNRTIDFLRRQKRRSRVLSLDDDTLFLEPIGDGRLNAEELLIEQQSASALAEAAAGLSEPEKQMLELIVSDQKGPEAAAAALGISMEALYTRKHRLIAKLKKKIQVQ